MKIIFLLLTSSALSFNSFDSFAQTGVADIANKKTSGKNYYIDVHQLEPGKVKYEDVGKAHVKDLEVEKKYGVHFIKYWVNKDKGLVYCLSSASDSESIRKTHAEAHGLLPERIYQVSEGAASKIKGKNPFFLDVHYLGAGKVTAKDVAGAHKKDLAVENKYGVNFINYWVDEKAGMVMCLSQAEDSSAVIKTHAAAHGLLPAYVLKVKQGE